MSKIIRLTGDGSFALEVSGESYYQANLVALRGPVPLEDRPYPDDELDPDDLDELENAPESVEPDHPTFAASLIREPTNKHDPNAVKVVIDGKQVGYLPRAEAKIYTAVFKKLKLPADTILNIPARIYGGYNPKKPDYGVWLDFNATPQVADQLRQAVKTLAAEKRQANVKLLGGLLLSVVLLCSLCVVLGMLISALE